MRIPYFFSEGIWYILALCCLAVPASAKDKMTVVVCMMEPHREFFEERLIAPFAKSVGVDVDVVNCVEIDDIEAVVARNSNTGLFMVPFGKAWSMVGKGKVQPLDRHLTVQQLRAFREEYILTWLGRRGKEQFFLPRKYETRIMVFRKSKVAEAVRLWSGKGNRSAALRDSIGGLLKSVNGRGLPKGYSLEENPGLWDFFDIFVVGALWASESRGREGRVGHRSKRYSGTALRVIDRVYQCGGDSLTMLAMNGDPVVDAFSWEAVYAFYGIYNSKMLDSEWSGRDLWEAFKNEAIYLSFLTQLDYFFLHGTDDKKLEGYIPDPSDLGFAVMPKGCSLMLDEEGKVEREGTKTVTNGGWWWAVPASWEKVFLSFQLFRHVTSRENQLDECTAFGMIPVRNDVLKNQSLLYKKGWISDLFQVSYEQVKINNNVVVPGSSAFNAISDLYLSAWFNLITGRKWAQTQDGTPDREKISSILTDRYLEKAKKILSPEKK
jgi:hypothetical protein